MEITSYLMGKKQGGGGTTINNQDKTITENGEYTADEGYTGLGTVTVNTPQPSGTINITANQENKDVAEVSTANIRVKASLTANPRFYDDMIYSGSNIDLSTVLLYGTSAQSMFKDCTKIRKVTFVPSTIATNNFRYTTTMVEMFSGCTNLTTLTNFASGTFENIDSSNTIGNMFKDCSRLNNDTLNEILLFCTKLENYTGPKTLSTLGLSSSQINICQSLSNYSAFVQAGWSAS